MSLANKQLIPTGPSGPRSLHRITDFLECPRRFALNWLKGYRTAGQPGDPLQKGILLHVGAAHHTVRLALARSGGNPENYYSPEEAMALVLQSNLTSWGEDGPRHLEMVLPAVQTLMRYERFEDSDILTVEQAYEFQIRGIHSGRLYTLTQKPDLIRRIRSTGKIKQTDWKSSSKPGAQTFGAYSTALQLLSFAFWGAMAFGSDYGGAEIYGVGLKAPYHFGVYPCEAAPNLVRQVPSIILRVEEEIERLTESGLSPEEWPASPTEHTCVNRYGSCVYRRHCMWGEHPLVSLAPKPSIPPARLFQNSESFLAHMASKRRVS